MPPYDARSEHRLPWLAVTLVVLGVLGVPAHAHAHGGQAIVVLAAFALIGVAAAVTMVAVWLMAGMLVGLLFGAALATISGSRILFVVLPIVNTAIWFLVYPFAAVHSSVAFIFLGIEDPPRFGSALTPPGLYLTLLGAPIMLAGGLASAALVALVARLLRPTRRSRPTPRPSPRS